MASKDEDGEAVLGRLRARHFGEDLESLIATWRRLSLAVLTLAEVIEDADPTRSLERLWWPTIELETAARARWPEFRSEPLHEFFVEANVLRAGAIDAASRHRLVARYILANAELERLSAVLAGRGVEHTEPGVNWPPDALLCNQTQVAEVLGRCPKTSGLINALNEAREFSYCERLGARKWRIRFRDDVRQRQLRDLVERA